MKLSFTMAFHPQTDDQMEKVSGVLNQYLKNYVGIDCEDWGDHLGLTKFCYNSTMYTMTKMSKFELVLGEEAKKPMGLTILMHMMTIPKK
jgi:hypothetical protein